MISRNLIAVALLGLLAFGFAGCSDRLFGWWGKPKGVPVTRPTSQDPNITFAEPEPAPTPVVVELAPAPAPASAPVAAPAPSPAELPAAAPAEPEAPPVAPAKPIEKPIDLTGLINAPRANPRFRKIELVATTMPASRAQPSPTSQPSPTVVAVRPATRTNLPHSKSATPAAPATHPPASPPVRPAAPVSPLSPASSVPAGANHEVVAASVVQVNRQFITIDDILRPLASRLDRLPKNIDEPTFRDQAARLIVREITAQTTRRLVVEEAEKRLVDGQKKMVDHEVRQVRIDMLASAGGSITKLRQKLAAEGLTLEQALDDYRRDATFRLYLRHRFMPAIPVTRKMLWDYYRRNHDQFATGRKVKMQLLAAPCVAFLAEPQVRPSQTELDAAKAKARRVIEAAEARVTVGDDFTEVVKKYSRGAKASTGGIWPLMEAGSFKETAVEKAAFQLPAGGVSDPIETPHGWYIVKAVEVISGRVVPFEEAQEQITEILRSRMYNELTDKYFDDLLKKSHITRSPEFNELALDRAVDRFWQK